MPRVAYQLLALISLVWAGVIAIRLGGEAATYAAVSGLVFAVLALGVTE